MSKTTERIQQDLKDAMKARDAVRLNVVRALKTAFTNAAIEKSGLGAELTDAESIAVIRKQLKQRQDSREQFASAGRQELADKEAAEIAILEGYLPASMSDGEIANLVREVVAETGASTKSDMGPVMKILQERAEGRADGRALSRELAKHLA